MEKRKKVNEYLKRIKEGERCMGELYEYTYGYVRYMAYKYTADKEKIKDVIDETYKKVMVNIEKFDDEKNGYNWICKIAHNEAMNANANKEENVRTGEKASDENGAEDRYDLERAIESLSEADRELLEYRVFEERTYKEIEALTGMTPVQAHRCLKNIYRYLKDKLS